MERRTALGIKCGTGVHPLTLVFAISSPSLGSSRELPLDFSVTWQTVLILGTICNFCGQRLPPMWYAQPLKVVLAGTFEGSCFQLTF